MRHSLIKTAAGRTAAAGDPLKVPGDSGGSSRESGTGGETIGRAVAGKLGYEYFDKKKIFGDLEEHGKQWARWGKEMDDHCPTVWERFDRSFAGVVALVEDHAFSML